MHLRSEALELVLSAARSVEGDNWVRVRAHANTGVFAGEFEAYLQLEDLRRFEREVRQMHANVGASEEAVLTSFETGIYVRLASLRLGGVAGTYRLEPERSAERSVELSGAFEADQSYLPMLAESIQALITALEQNDA